LGGIALPLAKNILFRSRSLKIKTQRCANRTLKSLCFRGGGLENHHAIATLDFENLCGFWSLKNGLSNLSVNKMPSEI